MRRAGGRANLCRQLVHHLHERVGRSSEHVDGTATGASCRVVQELVQVREQHHDERAEVRGVRDEVEQDVCERQVERRRDCGDESESGGRPRASRIASPYRRTVTWQKAEPSRMNGRALDAHVSGRGMGVLARHGRAHVVTIELQDRASSRAPAGAGRASSRAPAACCRRLVTRACCCRRLDGHARCAAGRHDVPN